MALKVVIATSKGKTYQKELSQEEAEALNGRVLGEEVKGDVIGLSGATLQLTGGSDDCGFPMRKDVQGARRQRILVSKSTGFRGKIRDRRFNGLRIKKTVAGNTVHPNTRQLNMKAKQGEDKIEQAFAPPAEESQEQATE